MPRAIRPEDLANLLQANPDASIPRPATRDECMDLVRGALEHPKVGDIVQWRSERMQTHVQPAFGESVIVTFVPPMVNIKTDADGEGVLMTMSIALAHDCGDPECERNGLPMDVFVDGRRFKTVGSVLA